MMSGSQKHACILPIPEFSAVGVDYDPLQSSAPNLGNMVRILAVLWDCLQEALFAPPTSPYGSDHIIKVHCMSLPS